MLALFKFDAEEVGLLGARAYAKARAEDGTLENHIIGSESDLGARKVWRLSSNVAEHAYPFFDAMQVEMQHLGILRGPNSGGGGPDMIPLQRMGMPVARLRQDRARRDGPERGRMGNVHLAAG